MESIKLLIQAVDNASGKIRQVANATEESCSRMSRAFEGLKNVATIAIGVIVRDLANKFGRAIGESVELASKMDTLQQSFNRLKVASGATGLSLEKLRKATRGTVADVDLLQSANQALLLGLPTEQLDKLYAAAMKLGSAMGISTKEAVESLTLGIGRQSKLILDNLGITFQASDAYTWYAEKIGKSVSELTESEKKLAWQQYAIKRVTEEARKLGDNISQTQIQQQQWNAQLTNFKTALGRVLSPLGGLISATKDFIPLVTVLATTNLPALISNIKGVGSAFTALFNLLMAHPIFLVIAAIAALIMILIHAYQTCEPFRNAIDALGQILLNVFKAAIDAVAFSFQLLLGAINFIVGAFKWLWDTITRNPLVALLLGPLTMLVWLFNNWDRVVKAVTGALRWLWNILRPVADLIGAVANALGSVVGWLFGSPKTIFEDAALGVRKLKRELRGLQFPAFPAGAVATAGGGTVINVRVDAQGAVFTDDYDVDRFMDRVVWRLRREVG